MYILFDLIFWRDNFNSQKNGANMRKFKICGAVGAIV